jgi:hypothetical protein
MATRSTVQHLLEASFDPKYAASTTKHYAESIREFQQGAWEESTIKAGKFVEAALKALWTHVGETVPTTEFKVGYVIDQLQHKSGFPETVRLTIPRACRLVYDIASNRGARHDPNEIDPNEMDAALVTATCGWILAEMLRYAQRGSIDVQKLKDFIGGLIEKKYPWVEDVDGRAWLHFKGLSARDIALLLLWREYPNRINRKDLTAAIERHSHSKKNATTAIRRLTGAIDEDAGGNVRLLNPGIQEAEGIVLHRSKKTK